MFNQPTIRRLTIGLLLVFVAVTATSEIHGQQRREPRLPEGVKAHRDLPYVTEGHERQKLDLYLPAGAEQPLPIVIWIHGGAWQAGNKGPGSVRHLLNHGYALACIEYRLSQHDLFPAQIHDCKAAVRWLRAHANEYGIDPKRIGVGGSSAGGHLAALLGTSGNVKELEGDVGLVDQPSHVQAVLDLFGPTDLTQMGGWHDRPDSPEARLIGGPVQENKKKAALANPIEYITPDDPPFLILHGDQDQVVPFSQSELLLKALKEADIEVTFVPVQDAGHGGPGFSSEQNQKRIVEFFDKHLKP